MDKAPWPSESDHAAKAEEAFDIAKRKAEHWCWQPIHRPEIPKVNDSAWPRDPIDNFILRKLEQADLKPAAATGKATWLRRVTFDLTGLPPTLAEIDAFLADQSEGAFETVVDRLLASPRYGERWARHWMDLIRYAETCGHEFDYPIPNAYRYRDYLIRAFNDDVPYDQFLTEHIAGDLVGSPRLHPETMTNESVLGTGFWFFGEATHGPVDVKGDEAGRVDNQIDVFGKTFLGLTIACARCHDHKFDAISAEDYYGIAGFLQSSRRQDVMLDPGQKIANAAKLARKEKEKVSRAYLEFISNLDEDKMYFTSYPAYMQAAIEYLQGHDGWKESTTQKLEGESLAVVNKSAGNPRPQQIRGWSGNKQLWWTDAKPGDSLELGFNIEQTNRYRVAIRLTTAGDYGIVQLTVNGKASGEPVDLYSQGVKRTKELTLGTFTFEQGKQTIGLEITGANSKANQAFMAGVDYITVTRIPKPEGQLESESRLEAFSQEYKIESDVLKRWVDAIKDPALKDPNHFGHMLRMAAESSVDLRSAKGDEFFRKHYGKVSRDIKANAKWDTQDEFGEFRIHDGFDNWYFTGEAFGLFPRGPDKSDVSETAEAWLAKSAPLHSGLPGPRFQGVARTPTFTINSEAIQILVSAKQARIRLVIDGFLLANRNALLFNDTIKQVDTDGQWRWIEMRGDIKKYIGHQAYLEFIDDSDGFIAVKDIRFRNERRPNQSRFTERLRFHHAVEERQWKKSREATTKGEDGLDPLQVVTNSVASTGQVGIVIPDEYSGVEAAMFNWMSRHRLFPVQANRYEAFEKSIAEYRTNLKKINDETPRPEFAVGMIEGTPETEFIFIRGNHKNLGDRAPRAPITALRDTTDWQWDNTSSQRLQLAHHMTDEDHPLVRRVIANRIWHHLTGRGLVNSVDNFGVLGEKPSHPELLDYLSQEFSSDAWSIKRLIKRIVLSQTYRMSSTSAEDASSKDPENKLLYKFRIRRLQGESIRDSMLAVSGRLDETMFGPSVPIHLTSFMQGRGRPGKNGPLDGNGRRSIYIEVRRNFLSPMMLAFDTPIPFNSIGRRNQSNVPAQALIMMNDPFVIEQAKTWAAKLIKDHSEIDDRLMAAVRMSTGRSASAEEIEQLKAFVNTQKESYDGQVDQLQLWSDVCHVLFNLKEFIYVK